MKTNWQPIDTYDDNHADAEVWLWDGERVFLGRSGEDGWRTSAAAADDIVVEREPTHWIHKRAATGKPSPPRRRYKARWAVLGPLAAPSGETDIGILSWQAFGMELL